MFARTLTRFHAAIAVALLALVSLAPQPVQAQAFSDYVENKIVDLLVRGQAFTAPATVYVGLSTGAGCTDATYANEVANSNGYARVKVAAGATQALTDWLSTQGNTAASTGTTGLTSNNTVITFPTPTGAGWGTVTYWFLADSGTYGAGNLLLCDDLAVSKTINAGDTVSFASGALTVTVQ
jgi:hypothetical protein